MSCIHIFLVNNHYSFGIADSIRKEICSAEDSFVLINIATKINFGEKCKGFNAVYFNVNTNDRNSPRFLLADIKYSKSVLKDLIQTCDSHDCIQIYTPNINHFLSNTLVFFGNTYFRNKSVITNGLAEGTLNYRRKNSTTKALITQLIKFILASPSTKYMPFFLDPVGFYNKRFTNIYCKFKRGFKAPQEKLIEIKTSSMESAPNKNTCLVLGQHLMWEISDKDRTILNRCLARFLLSNKFDDVFFKPHPKTGSKEAPELKTMPPSSLLVTEPNTSAENYANTKEIGTVVAIGGSTAFMELKEKHGDNINCIAIGVNYLSKKYRKDYVDFISLFKSINVTLLEPQGYEA